MLDLSSLSRPKLKHAHKNLEDAIPMDSAATRTLLCSLLRKGAMLGGDAKAASFKWSQDMRKAIVNLRSQQQQSTSLINTMPAYLRALMVKDYPANFSPPVRQHKKLSKTMFEDMKEALQKASIKQIINGKVVYFLPQRSTSETLALAEVFKWTEEDILTLYLESPTISSDRVTFVLNHQTIEDRWAVLNYLQQAALSALQLPTCVK